MSNNSSSDDNIKQNEFNSLFIEESEEITQNENINYLFTSSDSTDSKKKKPIKKSASVDKNLSNQKQEVLNATTGMSIIGNQISNNVESDNDIPDFIDNSDTNSNIQIKPKNKTKSKPEINVKVNVKVTEEKEEEQNDKKSEDIETFSETPTSEEKPKTPPSSPKNNKENESDSVINNKNRGVTNMVETMLKKDDSTNGWDHDANVTIHNWYKLFKQQSFIYQWVLDNNKKMSDRLATVSVISSSVLGIFSAFKLWIDNDAVFQTVSNILLMFFNFGVALLTSLSKRYIDDQKNEKIRTYIEEVDLFLGEIAAQVLKSPVYRMNADKFFKLNNDKYTKLICTAPNLSLTEIGLGKEEYKKYTECFDRV